MHVIKQMLALTIRKPISYILVLFVLGVVFLIFTYSTFAPVFLLSLYFAYVYLARKFSVTYIDSKFLLFVVTFFTHTAVLGLLVIICSAVSNASLYAAVCVELLIFGLLCAYEMVRHPVPQATRQAFSITDTVSLAIATLAVFLMAVVPLTNFTAQKQHSNTLVLISGNVDYGSHLALFNDYLGFGTVRTWGNTDPARSTGGGFYPSSWHAANAITAKIIDPSLQPGALSAVALGLINVFWLSVLVFLSVSLSFKLYELINKNRKKSVAVYAVITLLSLAAIYFFTVHIQRFGFFSFTPQLIAVLMLIYTLHQLLNEGIGNKSGLGLAVLYCSISLAAWILLLPVACGSVLLALVIGISRKRLRKSEIISEFYSNWPLYLIAIVSIMAQFWLILTTKSASTVTLGKGLLMDGGTPIYDPLVYALLFTGLACAIIACKNHKGIKPYEPIIVIVTTTVVFTCLLFAYQTYYTSGVHYYYLKSLLLIPAVLTPLAIAMAAVLMQRINDPAHALMLAIILPVLIIQLVPSDRGVTAFIRGSRTVSSNINNDVWAEMHNNSYPSKKVTAYFVNSGTNETSTIATLLVQANRPDNSCFTSINHDITFMSVDAALEKLTTSPLPKSCTGYSVNFKVDRSYTSIVKNASANGKYKVEFVND